MASIKELIIIVTFYLVASSALAASLSGADVTTDSTGIDGGASLDSNATVVFDHLGSGLGSDSKIPLLYMDKNCLRTVNLYSRNAVRLAPWSTKYPPSSQACPVVVQAAKYVTYRFVITFKKMQMSAATATGTCNRSRLDMYNGKTTSTSFRISGSDGICGRKPGFEEYTSKGSVLNLVYTTSGLPTHTFEYFEAVITPYHHGTCKHDEFKCANDRCIKNDLLCNGYNNCGDDSDEKSCAALLLSVAAIAGIVVGCVVLIGCICSIVICKCCCGACGYERI